MGKYDLLRDFLLQQRPAEVQLTFKQIEKIIVAPLPTGAMKPRWWMSGQGSAPARMRTEAWCSAGYDAELHPGRKVKFTRIH